MAELARRRRGDRTKNLVGFIIDDVHYAVDIQRVREILNPLSTVPIPHAPPAVLGVADHRGEVVPILDVRTRFGLPTQAPTRRTKWILVVLGDKLVGLVVDAVTEVFGASDPDQRSVPEIGVGDGARGIAAVYAYDGKLVFVLDVDRIAAIAEVLDMSAMQRLVEQRGEP
ncbi:MAG TPA: chemotaxis protein CheW [Sandaracinaceae bacterium LLY-WYZ-13_1]|nr:chemotaxis protein CheW [Sandaracinaceae bacterium LLY-WYZ-13_1]